MSGKQHDIGRVYNKLANHGRLSPGEARALFLDASDEQLRHLAALVRGRYHREQEATWTMMCIINFTNVCVAKCDFCAFYRLPHEAGTYTLTASQLIRKVEAFRQPGHGYIGFNGGFNPRLSLSVYGRIFGEVRKRFPGMTCYEMTIPEFMFYCKLGKFSYDEGAQYLRRTGTAWVPGGGAEVLSQSFRQRHSPGKYSVSDFYRAQAAVIRQGIGSTATMVIGMDETLDERLEHLERLRQFQDQWRVIPSFLCWTYKPYNTVLGGEEIGDREYFRWLALCRVYLDNIRHIRTSVLTKNENALTGLAYGADDFDLPTSDEVIEKAGGTIEGDFQKILAKAEDLGYHLVRRDSSLQGGGVGQS